MHIKTNNILQGKHNKPILSDIYIPKNATKAPVAIFCHGYKGFKDWGYWDLVAKAFAENGFCFIKFNFSHNGVTIQQPLDFSDLKAFATNNFSIELDDLEIILNWVTSTSFDFNKHVDAKNITLIGHSRGGGIAIIKAAEDPQIKKLITWASVCDFKARFADEKARAFWRENGVIYVENSRTKQQLPHYYQFYEDFEANEDRLTIKNASEKLKIPQLIIHGTDDPTVHIKEAQALHQWSAESELLIVENADHVFGGKHPWEEKKLPPLMQKAVKASIEFALK